jgi:hypothetical protein
MIPDPRKLDPKKLRTAFLMGNAVLTKAVAVIFGFWGGMKLDEKWGTAPYMSFLCGTTAVGLGIWYLIVIFKKIQR